MDKMKKAFTLAEVLITLAIIGVVAVMTIPTLVRNYQEKSWNTRSQVFETKLTQALKIMNSQGILSGYSSTEDFVDELSKNFKIANVCKDNPTDCFEDEVIWGEQTLDMTQVLTSKNFGMKDWKETNAVGLQFADGITGILAYNRDCRQDPYSNEVDVTSCISMVYDTSANSNPNENAKDVRILNVNRLLNAGCVVLTPDGICVTKTMFTPTSIDCSKTENNKYCIGEKGNPNYPNDYWAGARKTCGEIGGHLPSQAELTAIANDVYYPTTITPNGTTNASFDSTRASKYGITSGIYLWSAIDYSSSHAYDRKFYADSSKLDNSYRYSAWNNNSNGRAICVD